MVSKNINYTLSVILFILAGIYFIIAQEHQYYGLYENILIAVLIVEGTMIATLAYIGLPLIGDEI